MLYPLLFVHVTMHALSKYLRSPGERSARGGLMNLCPLWAILGHTLIWEADAKRMYCSAHVQRVQRAGESSWASWQNNSWEQAATTSHDRLLSSHVPSNSKERKKGPGARGVVLLTVWGHRI